MYLLENKVCSLSLLFIENTTSLLDIKNKGRRFKNKSGLHFRFKCEIHEEYS